MVLLNLRRFRPGRNACDGWYTATEARTPGPYPMVGGSLRYRSDLVDVYPWDSKTPSLDWRTLIGLIGKGLIMTLCPIAIIAGCKKCPAFSVCPLKTVIGDAPKASDPKAPDVAKK